MSTGIVDIYDLTSNIRDSFPQTDTIVNAVQESLKYVVIYNKNGEAKLNANGLSIYMPIQQQEFTPSKKFGLTIWQNLIDMQQDLLKNDDEPPLLQSFFDGEKVTGHIAYKDISNITLRIAFNSTKGNLIYNQNFEPSSFINTDGTFQFKWNREILSLCNEKKLCNPTPVIFEFTKDKKFAIIPVKLQSNTNMFNNKVSLIYEVTEKEEYKFLGATPEIDAKETISKEKYPLYSTDKIYTLVPSFKGGYFTDFSKNGYEGAYDYVESNPLEVLNPNTFKLKYLKYNETSNLAFNICDYSNNCQQSRWHHFEKMPETRPNKLDLHQLGYDFQNKDVESNLTTYVNPTYRFKIDYPTNWIKEEYLSDPEVVQFVPSQSDTQKHKFIGFTINAQYWPFPESLKGIADYNNNISKKTILSFKIIESKMTTIGDYPAYKTIYKGLDPLKLFEYMAVDIVTLVDNRLYFLTFFCDASEFTNSLSIVDKMIKSFDILTNQDLVNINSSKGLDENGSKVENDNTSQNIAPITEKFLLYKNPTYGYTIEYPYNWNIRTSQDNLVSFYSPFTDTTNKGQLSNEEDQVDIHVHVEPINTQDSFVSNQDLDKVAFRYLDIILISTPGINSSLKVNKTSITGNPVYMFAYDMLNVETQNPQKVIQYLWKFSDNIYVIAYFAPIKVFDTHFPILNKMIDSFNISTNVNSSNPNYN